MNMAQNVRFISVKLQATYDALETKDSLALYWIQDTQRLYKGSKLFGTGLAATAEFAGLMSPEDKAALDALIAGGGLNALAPVDGTITITDRADGGKYIGVAISNQEGNALVSVDGGLFVPTPEKVSVPEYTIEKQAVPEDGFATSYKLKKTFDGTSTYVGDTINIAKDMVLQSATLEIVTEVNKPYDGAVVGDPYIDMVFNDSAQTHIYIPVKGLVDVYTAGEGIEIVDGKISVKIAANSHGLVAVDGAMTMLLATAKQDGAMSKEDKAKLDAIPEVYVAKKYEILNAPAGTLVNYGEREIRIMCPNGAEYNLQNVGVGGDSNTYYVTFRTYAPSNDVVGYVEHLGGQSDAEILKDIKTDKYGRRYQTTWLGVARLDTASGIWNYYGKNSSVDKFIGWDYQIDWYDENDVMVASDNIRINLSNESCHNETMPYYMSKYATNERVAALEESFGDMSESYIWGEI